MSTTITAECAKHKKLKNNEYPLRIRITKDRKTKYISLGISIVLPYWDFIKNKPTSDCPNKEYIEKIISNKINELRDKVIELKSQGKDFTANTLVEKTINPTKPLTVKEAFDQYIDFLKDNKREGYALSVFQVYNSLIKFSGHLNIFFSEVDMSWLKKYETWLRKNNTAENTIGIRFRTLRVIFNYAIEQGNVKAEYYPFRKYKVSKLHQETAKRALTKEELLSVINYQTHDKNSYTILAIDIFTFSYYMGGINFADIAYLTKDNIIENRIVYSRKKTSKLITLPIHPKAMDILMKYGVKDVYIFPILSPFHKSEQQRRDRIHKCITKVNKALKDIGKELNLPIKLTTYVARHSFATVLKRSGVSTSIISESLGHSSEKITQVYLDSFENTQIAEALKNL
ncbi:site-specific integrase [Bacteroidales bacterium OttesenSCG-928-C19]|nr:site-specific integrase [Bacteroidales bacterium OttesenSCG-928-C19]